MITQKQRYISFSHISFPTDLSQLKDSNFTIHKVNGGSVSQVKVNGDTVHELVQ